MTVRFVALATSLVRDWQRGKPDANGMPPERAVASDGGLPCRHCLRDISAGDPYLTLAHRPFPAPQPYAELGPIFVHAEPCSRGGGDDQLPAFLDSPSYIVRGYSREDRIVYGTGCVVDTAHMTAYATELLNKPEIAYVHVRSAVNNCYQCRIERS